MSKQWLVYVFGILSGLAPGGANAQPEAKPPGVYAADLGTLYGVRYSLQVQKDVCISVQPKSRTALQKAYDDWVERNEDMIEDLDIRFRGMIKGFSRDQKEYSRLYGKYQGAVMSQRQEQKDALLALPKEELLAQCKELPGYLSSTKSNIPVEYPEEYKTVYGKK